MQDNSIKFNGIDYEVGSVYQEEENDYFGKLMEDIYEIKKEEYEKIKIYMDKWCCKDCYTGDKDFCLRYQIKILEVLEIIKNKL